MEKRCKSWARKETETKGEKVELVRNRNKKLRVKGFKERKEKRIEAVRERRIKKVGDGGRKVLRELWTKEAEKNKRARKGKEKGNDGGEKREYGSQGWRNRYREDKEKVDVGRN